MPIPSPVPAPRLQVRSDGEKKTRESVHSRKGDLGRSLPKKVHPKTYTELGHLGLKPGDVFIFQVGAQQVSELAFGFRDVCLDGAFGLA